MDLSFRVALLLWCSSILTCDCAPFQTVITGRSGSTSCVGDLVTYTCTVNAIAHTWRILSLGFSETISRIEPTFSDSQFSIVTTADEGGPMGGNITTALSVTSSAELNGATITCLNSNLVGGEVQEATIAVFGPPSAPGLTVVPGGDLASFNFTVTPSTPPDCVMNYIITANSSDGSRDITVPASEVDGSTPVSVDGFDRCATDYSFTVIPLTTEGNVSRSASVDIAALDPVIRVFTPNISLNVSGLNVTVTWELVDNLSGVTIGWSAPGESDCVNSATVGANVMQMPVQLDCDYDESFVVFCVQFMATSGCPSNPATPQRTVDVPDETCPPMATTSPESTTEGAQTTSDDTAPVGGGTSIGPIVGGVVGGILVAILAVVVIIIVIVIIKKKSGSDDNTDSAKPKVTYHSAGATAGSPQTSVEMQPPAPGAMYADPKAIEHEAAGGTGDQYALITSNTKAKKKTGQPVEAPAGVGDMYSVPDKTKKKQNQTQGLVYADIDIGQPQRPPPRSHGSQKQQQQPPQPDEDPVTYATVTSPI